MHIIMYTRGRLGSALKAELRKKPAAGIQNRWDYRSKMRVYYLSRAPGISSYESVLYRLECFIVCETNNNNTHRRCVRTR